MSRKFTKPDYDATLNAPIILEMHYQPITWHAFGDIVAHLDLSRSMHIIKIGRVAIAPEVLLALLFYGYATGRFSSRKIEKATYEDLGTAMWQRLHPDMTHLRTSQTFLAELRAVCANLDDRKAVRRAKGR